jgi:hypothetical protein
LDILKEKMVASPILVFLDWSKEFHVHVNSSSISLREVLAQPGEGDIDHPIEFVSRNLSESEQNYNTTKRRFGYGVCIIKV